MKKLGKLEINPEKLIKKEELISLRGGINCICFEHQDFSGDICGTGTTPSAEECIEMCAISNCWGSFLGLY